MQSQQDPQALTLLIAGKRVSAADGATFERRNPLDGEIASRAPAATPDDARAAVRAAWAAFPAWSNTGPGERRALLTKAAERLEAKIEQFQATMAAETGASGLWAGFNVHLAAQGLREAAAMTTQIAGEIIPSDVPGSLAMGVRQAAGVVLGAAGSSVLRAVVAQLGRSVFDPWAILVACAVLACSGVLACLAPALRAGRTAPMHALRGE